MQKNVAGQKWIVFAFDRTDNTPQTGDAANITANLRIDGGAANAVDDTNPTELEDGYYVFDITQAESNGELIVICPASGTSNIQVIGVPGAVYTTPPNFPDLGIETDGDVTKVNTLDGHTAQTGDTYGSLPTNFSDLSVTATTGRVDVASVAGTAQTANDNGADINAILVDTNELQTDWTNGGRLDLLIDSIISLLDDARSEPGDVAPPVNPDAMTKIDYLYKFLRNKIETTATRIHVYNDAGTNKDQTSVISDDGTTFTRGEFDAGDP